MTEKVPEPRLTLRLPNSGIKQVQSSSLSARQISPAFKPGGGDDTSHSILLDILSSVSDAHLMNTIGDERHVPAHSMEEASSTNYAHTTNIIIDDGRHVLENSMEEASSTKTKNANSMEETPSTKTKNAINYSSYEDETFLHRICLFYYYRNA